MESSTKTERITILGTPEFKSFLVREAKKAGISVSQFVRQRCENNPQTEDEEMLAAMVKEVKWATARAAASLEKGLADANQILSELGRKG